MISKSDHTVFAHLYLGTHTLTFDASGGYVYLEYVDIESGASYGSLPTPTRDYYDFLGWYTSPNGGTCVSSSTVMVDYDETIYAHWELKPLSGWVLESKVPQNATAVDGEVL